MLVKNLSSSSGNPLYLLELGTVRLLLDFPLDFEPLLQSLPLHPLLEQFASPEQLDAKPIWSNGDAQDSVSPVVTIEGEEFIRAPPCVTMPFSVKHCPVIWSSIDAVLVSNFQNILGIPFLLSRTDFSGRIFATEPSIEYGRQILEDIANSVDQLPQTPDLQELIQKLKQQQHVTAAAAAENWLPTFTLPEIEAAFASCSRVSFNEKVRLFNELTVTAVSSGFCIGGCNWLLETDFQRVAYISASSQWSCHPLPIDWQPLANCDAVIFNGISLQSGHTPDRSVDEICAVVTGTLAQGGNVLFPCRPCGVLYDLIETVANCLDAKQMQRYPMYFVSKSAKSSLSFCDIFGEWLSTERQKRLYTADAPFCHSELLELKRLSHFSGLTGEFSKQLSQPCIVFCSDASLRLGDAVHLMRAWGSSRQNALIITDPHFSSRRTVAPYQPIEMQNFFYPMDMRMQPSQAAELLSLLRCRQLLLPEAYSCYGLLPAAAASVQYLAPLACTSLSIGDQQQQILLEISPALARSVRPVTIGDDATALRVALLDGTITRGVHGKRRLEPVADDKQQPKQQLLLGSFGPEDLVAQLRLRNFPEAKHEANEDGSWTIFLECAGQEALVTGHADSTHIFCDDEKMRLVVRDSLLACLTVL